MSSVAFGFSGVDGLFFGGFMLDLKLSTFDELVVGARFIYRDDERGVVYTKLLDGLIAEYDVRFIFGRCGDWLGQRILAGRDEGGVDPAVYVVG